MKVSKSGVIDMFMGEYHYSIDEKGRITIPSKLRYELGENFILTRGLDGCLFIYPNDEWTSIIKNINNYLILKMLEIL